MAENTENAYQALASANEDAESRWAFGTGFDDPLADVGVTGSSDVPPTVTSDPAGLARHCVMLGDDALIVSHRLSQWCSHAPELEEELALANIGLDLLGQARLLYSRAASLDPGIRPSEVAGTPIGERVAPEDALAYFRDPGEFGNVTLAETENGDFARSIARLLVFSSWRLAMMARLADATACVAVDPVVAAIAAKAVKELTYHRDYAAGWVVRLGDGTPYSRERMREGMALTMTHYAELFAAHPVERSLAEHGEVPDPATLRSESDDVLRVVLGTATLTGADGVPVAAEEGTVTGRAGTHTPALTELLDDMQILAREYPEDAW